MSGWKLMRELGPYKYLPVFFLLGAGIELFMIKVRIGKETFCKSIFLYLSEPVTVERSTFLQN